MIIFSDKTLFSKIFSEKVKRYLEILKSKKIKIVLITSDNIKSEFKDYFFNIKKIKKNTDSKEIFNLVKKLSKKYKIDMNEIVLVANKRNFEKLVQKTGLSYCFKNSSENLKKYCEKISSLAEVLMFLK